MRTLPDWNAARFHVDTQRGHVESYFIKANAPDGSRAIWLKGTILASPGRASHALLEAWAVVFHRDRAPVAVKESRRLGQSHVSQDAFDLRIGDLLRMDADGSEGNISRLAHQVLWNFRWIGDRKPLVTLPYSWMYRGPVPTTKLVSPLPDLELRGTLTVDGEQLNLDGWKAMEGHNWGERHAAPYAWGHCNCWEQDEELIIEAATGRLSLGPLTMPPRTLVALRYRGETYHLNSLTHLLRNKGDVLPRRWLVRAADKSVSVEADFAAQSDMLAGMYYANPDGRMTYVANTKLAFAKVHVAFPGKAPIELTTRCAAWEFAEAHPPTGVTMLV